MKQKLKKIKELLLKIIYTKDCEHAYDYYETRGVNRRKCSKCGQKEWFNCYYKRWKISF